METLLIPILAGVAVASVGGALLMTRMVRRETRLARERALTDGTDADVPLISAEEAASEARLVRGVHRLGDLVSSGEISSSLQKGLASAGYHHDSAAAIYLGAKIVLFVVGVVGMGLTLLPMGLPLAVHVFAAVAVASVLQFLPNFVVNSRRRKRAREVANALPDAIDMMEICVESGMGMDMAWGAVAREVRRVSPAMSDEMELTSLEMSLGVTRADSMRHMAERTDCDELSSLVALLVQSERFGSGLVDALATFAHSLREQRSQRAEEAAERMSVKLLFPMVMFIFPALFIVMVGPACIELFKVLGGN